MKVSLNWLSEYIDLADYRERLPELSRILTQAGLEVEDMQDPSVHWDKVVVGKLIEVGKHPNADKLTLCQLDVGSGNPVQIVCGATNHKQGDLVAVAQVGAVLPGDFKINQSKIRDVDSSGMLCSETELGLSDESEGIIILPQDLKVGTPLKNVSGLSDVVFELNVTPNRADCLSHRGLARELSSLLDRPMIEIKNELPEKGANLTDQVQVEVLDGQMCPRYCGRMIRGVKVGESPLWLQQRLRAIGLNPINNVVDVTNFVLFELGQPLHAFDFKHLSGEKISVQRASQGEKFTTLDGTEVELTDLDLVIRDGARAVALAGVVGGQNSGVSESTQDLFIESAFFKAEGVRRTSRAHGIETDSCYRFSRGVDPEQTRFALDRAASLILQVAGGELQTGVVDIYPSPLELPQIQVTAAYVAERLGLTVTNDQLAEVLRRLGCQVQAAGEKLQVVPPSFRWDLRIAEDLVEEYARLVGYDQLGETLPSLAMSPAQNVKSYDLNSRAGHYLAGKGVHQAVNYAFIAQGQSQSLWGSAETAGRFGLQVTDAPVELLNPISEELSVMRESLLPSLLKNLVHNVRHGVRVGQLFEIAPVHFTKAETYAEESHLAMVYWGQAEGLWERSQPQKVLYHLKSTVEGLLASLGGQRWRWDQVTFENCPPGFHPGQSASLFYEGKQIGLLGSLHPSLKDKYKIRGEVAWVELNLDQMLMRLPREPKFSPLPKYPGVERDLAFVAPESVSAQDIQAEVKKAAGALLVDQMVFDLYQDQGLKDQSKKSIALRLHFQSEKGSLTDEEINTLRDKVVNSVCQKLGLEIR